MTYSPGTCMPKVRRLKGVGDRLRRVGSWMRQAAKGKEQAALFLARGLIEGKRVGGVEFQSTLFGVMWEEKAGPAHADIMILARGLIGTLQLRRDSARASSLPHPGICRDSALFDLEEIHYDPLLVVFPQRGYRLMPTSNRQKKEKGARRARHSSPPSRTCTDLAPRSVTTKTTPSQKDCAAQSTMSSAAASMLSLPLLSIPSFISPETSALHSMSNSSPTGPERAIPMTMKPAPTAHPLHNDCGLSWVLFANCSVKKITIPAIMDDIFF